MGERESAAGDELADALQHWAAAASEIFDRCRRPDLAESARSLSERAVGHRVRVAVIGDFKRGKSTLVNAIVGDEPCSTEVVSSTVIPTVCRHGQRRTAWVVERRDGVLRRREVSAYESRAAQEGGWPEAVAAEIELPSATIADRLELIDCPPASGRRGAHAASVEAGCAADVVLFVTDATQPLTQPEVQLLQALDGRVPTIVVVAKCDLVVHWRRVVDEDRSTLSRFDLRCDVVPVAALLRSDGRSGAGDRSGIARLLDDVLRHGHEGRRPVLLTVGPDRLISGLRTVRDEQVRLQAAFGDRERLRDRQRDCEAERDQCDMLRLPTAHWQRQLDARTDAAAAVLRERTQERLAAVRDAAATTLERIDPNKDWETFEPWLRDEAGAVAAAVISEAEPLVESIGHDVARTISASGTAADVEFSVLLPQTDDLRMGGDDGDEQRMARFMREGFATLGSTSAGLLAFATLGGVLSAAVLAPLTVVLGAGLGGTAVLSERRTERATRQQRATDAVEEFLSVVAADIDETLSAGLGDFRNSVRDDLMARIDERVQLVRDELQAVRRGLEDAELARDRVAEVSRNLVEIDELIDRIRRRTGADVSS